MAASVRPEVKDGGALPRPKTLRPSDKHPTVREDLAGLLAHDLKTPLAAIAMNLDFALSEVGSEGRTGLRSALEDCRHANARAIRIVSDMADVVRLAMGDYLLALSELDPSGLLDGVVGRAADEAEARGVRIAWSAEDGVIPADPDLLARALDRLVERALRHARVGSVMTIDYAGGTIVIRVQSASSGRHDATNARALALHFAEAALNAQGGALFAESDGLGSLSYRVTLITP
ncbi:MAG: sensor histidine kinase [Polyangiaceae bacterium]|jgi:signal transduction histidine kinase